MILILPLPFGTERFCPQFLHLKYSVVFLFVHFLFWRLKNFLGTRVTFKNFSFSRVLAGMFLDSALTMANIANIQPTKVKIGIKLATSKNTRPIISMTLHNKSMPYLPCMNSAIRIFSLSKNSLTLITPR